MASSFGLSISKNCIKRVCRLGNEVFYEEGGDGMKSFQNPQLLVKQVPDFPLGAFFCMSLSTRQRTPL